MSTQWQQIKPSDILTGAESHALRQRSDLMGFWLLAHAWGVIALSMALFALFPNILTFLIAVTLIGGRQLGLAILMHEGSHGMLFRTRNLNEKLTAWFAAWPMIIDMKAYRLRHMAHHRFTRTEKDPENYLYTPFPVTKYSLGRKILRDLTGIAFLRGQIGLFRAVAGAREGRSARLRAYYRGPLTANGALFLLLALMGRPDLFLWMWLLPMATVQQLVVRIRNIAEHSTMPDLDDPLQNSRTTLAGPLVRAVIAPYWVNYHIEHHMMPYIPCYRLPDLHKIMLNKGLGERMEIRQNYWEVLRLNAAA